MRKIFIDPGSIDYSLVHEAAQVIFNEGIVALPTETVYGLAGRADKKEVVEKLYKIKQRPGEKPFAYVVDNPQEATDNYFFTLPPFGYRLIERFWPGPLTIIYYAPDDRKIGVRVPSHVVAKEIFKEANVPVYLPSANISGEKEAVSASEVEAIFDGKIDLVVDSGSSSHAQASTVIDLTQHPFKILREGVVLGKDIVEVFVKKRVLFVCTGNSCRSPLAQFLLEKYLREVKPHLESRYQIISCGIHALENSRISTSAASILRDQEGIDARWFRAKKMDRHIILSSDLIFTMEDSQSNYILSFEPTVQGRIFSLKKFLPPQLERDIPDPIGGSFELYGQVYSLIKSAILEIIDWL